MEELLKLLDPFLVLENINFEEDRISLYTKSTRTDVVCPYCKTTSNKVHSHYSRSFQDLPIQGNKVTIVLDNRKMFCQNPNCGHKTFAEKFSFLVHKSKKTIRLEDEIVRISQNISSVKAAKLLKKSVAMVGKSTICNILKKRIDYHQERASKEGLY